MECDSFIKAQAMIKSKIIIFFFNPIKGSAGVSLHLILCYQRLAIK